MNTLKNGHFALRGKLLPSLPGHSQRSKMGRCHLLKLRQARILLPCAGGCLPRRLPPRDNRRACSLHNHGARRGNTGIPMSHEAFPYNLTGSSP